MDPLGRSQIGLLMTRLVGVLVRKLESRALFASAWA